jgi:hypothetical protein
VGKNDADRIMTALNKTNALLVQIVDNTRPESKLHRAVNIAGAVGGAAGIFALLEQAFIWFGGKL